MCSGFPKETAVNKVFGGKDVDYLNHDEKTIKLLGGLKKWQHAFPWVVRLRGKCGGGVKGKTSTFDFGEATSLYRVIQ